LMEHIAVAVQRGNAEIMIRHSASPPQGVAYSNGQLYRED
jgi:hypothetical protein